MKKGAALLLTVIVVGFFADLRLGDALSSLSLLLFSSIAFAIPARAGFFNLGIHAQLIAGALAAVAVMQHWRHHMLTAVLMTLLVAGLAGAVTGAVPLALRQWGGVNEVISSILLNGLMVTLGTFALRFGVKVTSDGVESIRLAEFQRFGQFALGLGALLLIAGYVIFRRSFLWTLSLAQGESPTILRYSGFRPEPYMWLWVTVAAAIAGLGAALRVLDEHGKFAGGEFGLMGFSGIVGATLFGDRPPGLISACILLATLEALRQQLQVNYGVSSQVFAAFEACALLLLLLRKQRQEARAQ